MPSLSLGRYLPFTLLVAVLACSGDRVSAPIAEESDFEPAQLELAAMDRGDAPPALGDRRVPTLQRVLHEAILQVRTERGVEAARRLLEPLHRLLAEARAAREAGDLAAARRLLHEANLYAARTIVRVLGPEVVGRLDAAVTTHLAALRDRIAEREAAGEDVTRLTRTAGVVERLQGGAARLTQAGAHARALLLLAHALDLLQRASHD